VAVTLGLTVLLLGLLTRLDLLLVNSHTITISIINSIIGITITISVLLLLLVLV